MIRSINIEPVLNGFVVKVGCQIVVFKSIHDMVDHICNYYANPEDYEEQFIKECTVNDMLNPRGGACIERERQDRNYEDGSVSTPTPTNLRR